jgi:hypothetical protein
MPRIRCHYFDCVFLDDDYCSAAQVEIDPDMGCMTFKRTSDVESVEDWEEDEGNELEDWDELDIEDDDELWMDDDF